MKKMSKSRVRKRLIVVTMLSAAVLLGFGKGVKIVEKISVKSPDIKVYETLAVIEDKDKSEQWNLLLVNPWNKLPNELEFTLAKLKNGHFVDERILPDLQKMMDDARLNGLNPIICSSYRTKEKQTTLYNNQVQSYINRGYSKENAQIEAGRWVALPDTSEHQTGLALDIVSLDYQVLDKNQENTPEQKWLMNNCHKYGFILRYPEEKAEITGIGYEPWHYRYVGINASKEIMEKGICLEEYLA